VEEQDRHLASDRGPPGSLIANIKCSRPLHVSFFTSFPLNPLPSSLSTTQKLGILANDTYVLS